MSGAYVHRALGPSAAGGAPNAAVSSRLNDLLDFVRQEYEAAAGEAQNSKLQNMEYENHAHSQIKEMATLRHSFLELQRELEASKAEYESEIIRLRRELDHRGQSSVSSPAQQAALSNNAAAQSGPSDPRDSRNHQQLQSLYSLLPPMNAASPAASSSAVQHSSQTAPASLPPAYPPIARPSSSHQSQRQHEMGNGHAQKDPKQLGQWRREDLEARLEHPSKRLKMDEMPRPASGPATPHEQAALAQTNGRPPTLALPMPRPQSGGHQGRSTPSSALPPNLPHSALATRDQSPAAPHSALALAHAQHQHQQRDWHVMQNPKVKRSLDIDLKHTLVHDSVVCCVKFSPDAKLLATGCNRNTILYNTETGQRECTLVDPSTGPKDDNYIRSACFSPDGKLVATGSEDRKIRIWDIATRTIKHIFEGHKNEIYSLVFSPDGRLLYSGSGDSSIGVWDMERWDSKMILQIEDQTVGDNGQLVDAGVTSVALSPDGRLLAAGSLDNNVRLWNAQTGQKIDRLKGHKDSVYSVVFGPDANWLVSGSLDKNLKIWDLGPVYAHLAASPSEVKEEDGAQQQQNQTSGGRIATCLTTLVGHKDYVLSVAVPTDGQWIVSGSKDRGVSFWDPKATLANVVLQGHKNSVISIAVSEVGNLLATGSGDWSCRIWKFGPTTGEQQQE